MIVRTRKTRKFAISLLIAMGIASPFAAGEECVVSRFREDNEPCCSRCERGALFRWPGAEAPGPARPERIVSDQPHIAESAAVVGRGTIQLEQDFVYTRENSGGTTVDNFSYPNFLLRWGMIRDWFELRLGWSYNEESTSQVGAASFHRDGGDDLYIGAKIAIAEQHGILPQLAIFPQMVVPAGAGQFSDDEVLPGVNIAYGWEIKEDLGLEVNTQINRVRDDVDEFYTEVLQVVNVGWDIRENIMLFSEVIGFFPNSARVTRPKYVYHGGMQYYPNDDVTIYLHASGGLNEAADNFFAGIGVAIRTGN